VHKWGLLPRSATKKESGEATKYFQVQIGWLFDGQQPQRPLRSYWIETVTASADSIEGVSLRLSNTQATDPVVAIQFLKSAINISGKWDDNGHADCTADLHQMVKTILGPDMDIGIASRKFDGGKYTDRTPNVMVVECDKSQVQRVQQELVATFAKLDNSEITPEERTTKRARILNGIVTNWVAVPTFSTIASKTDKSKIALYSQMEAQEMTYRAELQSCKVQGVKVNTLDLCPSDLSILSPDMLLQMENTLIEKGDTPIRFLIYDKAYSETKEELIKKQIPADAPDEESKEKKKELETRIQWREVTAELERKKIPFPYSTKPIPNPWKMSLRKKLLSIKSRRLARENILVFESVTITDEGELLLTFKNHCEEEARTIAELLPLFIKFEMGIDPQFYCHPSLLQAARDGYYNPLLRTGYSSLMRNVVEVPNVQTKKSALPAFCKELPAAELMKVFKCPGFSALPFVSTMNEDDLASLADSIATSPNPQPIPEEGIFSLEKMMQEAKMIETTDTQDDMSDVSGASFDSAGSYNRLQIHARAQLLASQLRTRKAMEKMIEEHQKKPLTPEAVKMYCKIGEFSRSDLEALYPVEAKDIWKEKEEVKNIEKKGSKKKGAAKKAIFELEDDKEEKVEGDDDKEDENEDEDEESSDEDDEEDEDEDEESSDEDSSDEDSSDEDDKEDEDEDGSFASDDTEKKGSPKKGAGALNSGGKS